MIEIVSRLRKLINAHKQRREWSAERQLHELRKIVMMDNRWLAHDTTASELTWRYLKLLDERWYKQSVEDVRMLRERLGLSPVWDKRHPPPCVPANPSAALTPLSTPKEPT